MVEEEEVCSMSSEERRIRRLERVEVLVEVSTYSFPQKWLAPH